MPIWHSIPQVRNNKHYYSNYQQKKQEVKLGYILMQRKSALPERQKSIGARGELWIETEHFSFLSHLSRTKFTWKAEMHNCHL